MTPNPVFISHSTVDDASVTRLRDGLEAVGIGTWVDHLDIAGSDDWDAKIQTALHTHKHGVFVLSPHSAQNANCKAEWWHFLNQPDRRLYVVLLAPVEDNAFPWRLKTVQYVDFSVDFETGLKTLIDAVQRRDEAFSLTSGIHFDRPITGYFPHGQFDIPLTGRDADLDALTHMLVNEKHRLLVITAVGGTGKTRVALEVASSIDTFTNGVIWLTLNDTNTEDTLTGTLRDHLKAPAEASADEVWEMLRHKRILMVLDNAEAIPNSQRAAIAKRLEHYPLEGGSRVLMTSREQWRECRPFNRAYPLGQLNLDAAEQIVRDMARAQGVEAAITGHEREFAEKAHCHPRIIRYAVSWLAHETLPRVRKMLTDASGEDMQALLDDVLYRTLDQIKKVSGAAVIDDLKRLLVCRGGFTEDAATALIGANNSSMGILRRWNLITEAGGRYIVDSLAETVLEPDESAYLAHYEFYYSLMERHDQAQDYIGFVVESDNLTVALTWALKVGELGKAYLLYEISNFFLLNRGRFNESKTWLLAVAERLADYTNNELRALVQCSLGTMYANLPTGNQAINLRQAIKYYQMGLAYFTPEISVNDYAVTKNNLGNTFAKLANFEMPSENLQQAMDCYKATLDYYRPKTQPLKYALAYSNLGNVYRSLANIQLSSNNLYRARRCYQIALKYQRPDIAPLDYAMTQTNLGNVYMDLATIQLPSDNFNNAINCYQIALDYRTPDTAPLDYATTKHNLGFAYHNLANIGGSSDNYQFAIACYQTALAYWTPENSPLNYAMAQNNLGNTYLNLANIELPSKNLQRAIECYQNALNHYTSESVPRNYAMTQGNLGFAYQKLGKTEQMCNAWREAERCYRQVGIINKADEVKDWLKETGC